MRRWLRDAAIACAATMAIATLWAIATPLMAIPDEPAHVVRAAGAVRGDLVGTESAAIPGGFDLRVPPGIAAADALTCMRSDDAEPADCQPDVSDAVSPLTGGWTTATLNLPTYYVLVGWPSLLVGGEAAMWAMRIVSALLCSLCVGVAVAQVRTLPRHGWVLTGLVVSATPMALWLLGGVNPNGLEWAATLALLATLLALGRAPRVPRMLPAHLAIVVASTLLLVSGRSITLLWLLVVVAAGLLLARPSTLGALLRTRATWVGVAGAGVVVAGALAWIATAQPSSVPGIASIGAGESPGAAVRYMLRETVRYWSELIGMFGWREVTMPPVVLVAVGAVLLGMLAIALAVARGRTLVALLGALGALLVVPVVVQASLVGANGYIWQGRYVLALLAVAMLVAGVALDERSGVGVAASADGRRIRALAVATCGVATIASMTLLTHRYAVGDGAGWAAFVRSPEWSPAIGTVGAVVAFAAAVAATAVLGLRAAAERPARVDAPVDAPRDAAPSRTLASPSDLQGARSGSASIDE